MKLALNVLTFGAYFRQTATVPWLFEWFRCLIWKPALALFFGAYLRQADCFLTARHVVAPNFKTYSLAHNALTFGALFEYFLKYFKKNLKYFFAMHHHQFPSKFENFSRKIFLSVLYEWRVRGFCYADSVMKVAMSY